MTPTSDMLLWLEAFTLAEKEIVSPTVALPWLPGHSLHEKVVRYPLSVVGEITGELQVTAFPAAKDLTFRLALLGNDTCVCRLDYTDETHPNDLDDVRAGLVPPDVVGPHIHPWQVNRRFFETQVKAIKLHNALPLGEVFRSFDAGLRWFCSETKIFQPPGNHAIALPKPERML